MAFGVKFSPSSGLLLRNDTGGTLGSVTFTQTYATAATTVPTATAASVVATASTSTTPFGYSQAQADALVTAVNALVADSLANRQLLNAVIDTLQALGLAL